MTDDPFTLNMQRLQTELGKIPTLPKARLEDFAPKSFREVSMEQPGVMSQAKEIRELAETLANHLQDFIRRVRGIDIPLDDPPPSAQAASLPNLQDESARRLGEAIKVMNQLEAMFFGGTS